MMKMKILNGQRIGHVITLNNGDILSTPKEYILEDEAIEIILEVPNFYNQVQIVLHENEVESNSILENDNIWFYKWYPKRIGRNSFECFFHNYFGIAELQIKLISGEEIEFIRFPQIEILAKKINAERVNDMLSFLAKHNSDALCAFFRVTRRSAGYKEGDTPVDILIEQLEKVVLTIHPLLDKIIKKPITKLTLKDKYIFPNESTKIDDITLAWISDNTDELYETDNSNLAILEHEDKLFGTQKLRENSLVEDCNVYENQVIHGFIKTLIITTSSMLTNFEKPKVGNSKFEKVSDGYSSFFSQINKFHRNINLKKVEKCKEILSNLSYLRKKIDTNMYVSKKITGIPSFTMKAKHNPSYLIIFNKIANWHRFGKPDWSIEDELFSIKSIPKLFEYYTLFYIKGVMDSIFKASPSLPSVGEKIRFKYTLEDFEFSLDYEPKYWVVGHPKTDHRDLINSEQWTMYNGKATRRSTTNINANRSPDFVINLTHENKLIHSYILDAKYTYDDKVFSHYIPELTLKYLHGLHPIGGDNKVIIGLMIINPSNAHITRHFHNNVFNIFSDNPVYPSIISSSVKPGDEESVNSEFERVIKRIIALMLLGNDVRKDLIDENVHKKLLA
ncbi:DUF2357 domain-containing protein [Ewingella americana]|uniref:DUF2357 domain-containing protein n=1 Tax=Ewingella americana TaxID=41202 RepID=UPI001883E5F5|nr:DUF2357 domain-containing protein [Ewingella americana]